MIRPHPPTPIVVSRDGASVALRDRGRVTIFPTTGGEPRVLDGALGRPIHWSVDGEHLILAGAENYPARLSRRHLATGRIEPWRTLAPPDPSGVMLVGKVLVADDERSLVYMYGRGLNDLYLVRGVR